MRSQATYWWSVAATCLLACGGAAQQPATFPSTGVYSGTYAVPVSDALSGAATYAVKEYEWTRAGDQITFAYKLPLELVGVSRKVQFSGRFATGAETANLSGRDGTAVCTRQAGAVECKEDMHLMQPIEHDLDRVKELAPSGLGADRVQITSTFISDPIGVARFAF